MTAPTSITYTLRSPRFADAVASGPMAFDAATGTATAGVNCTVGWTLNVTADIDGTQTAPSQVALWPDRTDFSQTNFTVNTTEIYAGERVGISGELKDRYGNTVEYYTDVVECVALPVTALACILFITRLPGARCCLLGLRNGNGQRRQNPASCERERTLCCAVHLFGSVWPTHNNGSKSQVSP